MAEIQENRIESSYTQDIKKELNDIPSARVHDVKFSDTLSAINAIKDVSAELYFNTLISWKLNFDWLKKDEKNNIQYYTTLYIQDKQNKENVLDNYLKHENKIPDWIKKIIENTYSHEEIWEYELKWYFNTQDIISWWKEINGENWDGSNIYPNNPNIYKICTWSFFSEEQLITKFNELNEERTRNNENYVLNIDVYKIIEENLNVTKAKWILYINGEAVTDNSILFNEDYINLITNSEALHVANKDELKNILHRLYTPEDDAYIYKNIYDRAKESNENYIFHDTWLNFMTELELKDEETILSNFIKNTKPNQSIEEARANNPDLPKIMAELVIKEDDTPDTKYEKSKLIYLLNNGLFRWFLMAIDCLKPGGVDSEKSSPYLKADKAYNWLQKHLNRYQKEKNETFYQLISDIGNLKINFNSDIIKHSTLKPALRIWPHLRNPWTKWDIEQIVGLAKSFFIQRIKDGQTTNTNIETYKNQLAYILATMQFECRYNYAAVYKNIYYWYWQINGWYTWLREIFAQGSWLDIWLRGNKGNPIVWPDIKVTKDLFTDKNFAGYAFVYGLTYWHLSNQWNLDDYINDNNIKNPDYKGARRVEAGVYSPGYDAVAKEWRKIIDDSI